MNLHSLYVGRGEGALTCHSGDKQQAVGLYQRGISELEEGVAIQVSGSGSQIKPVGSFNTSSPPPAYVTSVCIAAGSSFIQD
ncbi:hypothetical protein PAMP_021613 [Pampus punctatissimus]